MIYLPVDDETLGQYQLRVVQYSADFLRSYHSLDRFSLMMAGVLVFHYVVPQALFDKFLAYVSTRLGQNLTEAWQGLVGECLALWGNLPSFLVLWIPVNPTIDVTSVRLYTPLQVNEHDFQRLANYLRLVPSGITQAIGTALSKKADVPLHSVFQAWEEAIANHERW